MPRKKVFGVGLHRTGTTTLQTALEELGYDIKGMREVDWNSFESGDFDALKRSADERDGYRDLPWPLVYEWLDKTYPDARFVLTYRDADSWIRSCRAVYGTRPYPFLRHMFGADAFVGNEARAREVYEAHIRSVRAYFADKQDRFLEVDFTRGDGWQELCGFLGEPIPQRPFPHANVGSFTLMQKVRRKLLKWFRPNEYLRRLRDR